MLRIGRVPTSLTLLFWLLLTVCWVFKGQSADVMLADDCDAQVMTAGEEEEEDTTAGDDAEEIVADDDDSEVGRSLPTAAVKEAE